MLRDRRQHNETNLLFPSLKGNDQGKSPTALIKQRRLSVYVVISQIQAAHSAIIERGIWPLCRY